MGTARTPAGTRIFMQSADAGAKQAITAISTADPAVITYAGADPANATYMAMVDLFGMTEFEDALVKVSAVNTVANTFEAEDQSSVGYGAFVSGNIQPIIMALEMSDATGFSISGFEQQFASYGLLRDRITRQRPTVVSPGTVTIPHLWDPTTAATKAIIAAADTAKKLGFKILFPDGLEVLFFGYIGASGLPTVQDINTVMETQITVSIASRPRYVLP